MILEKFRLDGKVALVTGAARGIGQAIAVGLAEAGADVALLDRLDSGDTRNAVAALGKRSAKITCDLEVLDADKAAAVIAECVVKLGHLDILVNNAGIIRRSAA